MTRCIVYFHGTPGAPAEAAVLQHHAAALGLKVICPDRYAVDARITGERYFQALADDIVQQAQGRPVDIVGFSMGAFVALQVCRLIPGQVASLHLVAAAAPLDGGDFLPHMAGKTVFAMARAWPVVFKLMSYWQGLLASVWPSMLYKMLFASAVAGDHALARDADFRELIGRVLQSCFSRDKMPGYLRDVQAYVSPWRHTLTGVTVKTHLWHGDQDNWAPVAMSTYLAQALKGCEGVHILTGLSHYSALYAAAPQICALCGRDQGAL